MDNWVQLGLSDWLCWGVGLYSTLSWVELLCWDPQPWPFPKPKINIFPIPWEIWYLCYSRYKLGFYILLKLCIKPLSSLGLKIIRILTIFNSINLNLYNCTIQTFHAALLVSISYRFNLLWIKYNFQFSNSTVCNVKSCWRDEIKIKHHLRPICRTLINA